MAHGLQLVHPSDWHVLRRRLTQVIEPRTRVALGTFRLRQRRPDPTCSPVTALRARGPADGFVHLIEYARLNPRQLARFPRRPAHLRLPRSSFGSSACNGPSWTVTFRDGGRAFQAHVYGPPRRRREALTMLDSLHVPTIRRAS